VTDLEEWNESWEHEWLVPSLFESGPSEVTVVHPLRERDHVVTVVARYGQEGHRRQLYVKGGGWDETNYWDALRLLNNPTDPLPVRPSPMQGELGLRSRKTRDDRPGTETAPEPRPRRSVRKQEKIERDVREELDEMFKRLAERWQLASGDVSPDMVYDWEEVTLPAILRYGWQLYQGNQVPYVIVDAPGFADATGDRRTAFRLEPRATQSPRGVEATRRFDEAGEPRDFKLMEPDEEPGLQEKIRDLLQDGVI
jgi:hypothetical protein